MKTYLLPLLVLPLLVLVLLAFPAFAGQETMDLLLNDGSKIKGKVMSVTASEVTVMSDFGVLRLDSTEADRGNQGEAGRGHYSGQHSVWPAPPMDGPG